MQEETLWYIFINASLINNFVLAYFLGICPFLGVSGKMETATKMGGAVTFVMLISSMCAFGIHPFLVAINAPFPATDQLHRCDRFYRAIGRDVHQKNESGFIPGPGYLFTADHHQLCDPGCGSCSRRIKATVFWKALYMHWEQESVLPWHWS
jgi:hypothetical protein